MPKVHYAGDDDMVPVCGCPDIGTVLYNGNAESGHLEKAKIIGYGGWFDQYRIIISEWLTGPDKGTIRKSYSNSFWIKSKS